MFPLVLIGMYNVSQVETSIHQNPFPTSSTPPTHPQTRHPVYHVAPSDSREGSLHGSNLWGATAGGALTNGASLQERDKITFATGGPPGKPDPSAPGGAGLGILASGSGLASLKLQSASSACPLKEASVQEFVVHDFDCSEHGTSQLPKRSVHRIGILDLRLFNTDRHAGNILVRCAAKRKNK